METIVIGSGGLDSVTLAYKVAKENVLTRIVSFDYGQRHKKELRFAELCAQNLNVPWTLIDMSHIGAMLSGSALTDNVSVPDGHYAEDTMKITVVPNRNAIFLAIAYGLAASQNAKAVATAIHGGDHFIYPDCRPGFAAAFEDMEKHALEGFADITLYTPFIKKDKAAIVTEGVRLNVPFERTWSCYKGGDIHCGRCGTCVERQEAFHQAGIQDPTCYEDSQFWKEACHV